MTKWKKGKRSDYMFKFPTVVDWLGQLNNSGVANCKGVYTSTKIVYLSKLTTFNEWLAGRKFDMRVSVAKDNKIVHENVQKSFANVEELLYFGEDENGNAREIRKIINKHLMDPMHEGKTRPTMTGTCAAIKSYFDKHDVMTYVKFNGRKRNTEAVADAPELTRPELFKMLTVGKTDHLTRAVMLVKFQAGLDRSTLADRFNFYAYSQISKFCGTDNHREWSPDKCPIPIKIMRVKTDYVFTTFIDRDALSAIKDYLAWREEKHGPHDPDGPIFFTTRNAPVSIEWVSEKFGKLAEYAQTQKRLGLRTLKIHSHETRHLLKTTMVECGCAARAADHFLGHKSKDPYLRLDGKTKTLRKEYSKASHVINILSKAASSVEDTEPDGATEEELKASKAQVEELKKEVNDLKAKIAKEGARSADVESRNERVLKAIIDASNEPDGDFRQNLKDRLGGLL